MEAKIDFVKKLSFDVSVNILLCLNDPTDVVHAAAVSRLWRKFMIENGISKQVCVRKFPQLCSIVRIGESSDSEFESRKREHEVYTSLFRALETLALSPADCIEYAVGASSTDNYPFESISNTITRRGRHPPRLYWSSKGQSNPDVPETLIYKLKADFGVLTEIDVQPFKAYFQNDNPIYSAKSVRFRLGFPKSSAEIDELVLPVQQPADDKFVWTYTSEEFPMVQENCLQTFKLPEPVLYIGGYLQIELRGRVQRQEADDLFYICVHRVRALGRSLSPALGIEILEQSGKFSMMYSPEKLTQTLQNSVDSDLETPRPFEHDVRHIGLLGYMLGFYDPDVEVESDEEFEDELMADPL